MYLPKSKYTIKQAAPGMFILSGSPVGEFYVGPYIEDYLGRTFAGKDILKAWDRVLYRAEEPEQSRQEVVTTDHTPKEENYQSGSYIRYFRRNRVTKVTEEITEDQVDLEGPWNVISGSWILTGSLDDIYYDRIPYRGVRFRNQQTLDKWEVEMPGIVSVLELKPEDFVKTSQE